LKEKVFVFKAFFFERKSFNFLRERDFYLGVILSFLGITSLTWWESPKMKGVEVYL